MANKGILIIGAGLAGLSAAWHLQRKGVDCRVFEKEPEIGGLCRSKKIAGFTFDCDGHLLHFRHRYTFRLIQGLLKGNLIEHQRSAWIYSSGRYSRYPFQANLHGLPLSVIKDCLLGFLEASKNGHSRNRKKLNFLDWITLTFGRGIARHFMVPYNAKFWKVPLGELTCDWLDGFIPVPSLNQIIEGATGDSKMQLGYNARFWYPKREGIASVPLAFTRGLKNLYTNAEIIKINLRTKEITLACGSKEKFDRLIFTLPLPEMPNLITEFPARIRCLFSRLRWNSIFNLNLGLDKKDELLRHWVYFPDRKSCFFRVGFSHNFSPSLAPPGKGSLYTEVSYSKTKPFDKRKIVARIKEDLKKVGILTEKGKICSEDINDIKYAYPVYDKHYHEARGEILKYLMHNDIIPCGRYGSWRYMSMEDVLLNGKTVADNLL